MEVDSSGNLLMKLPEEIVEMVLRHLDPDARREAVLVCQAFYEHICRLEKDSRALKINNKVNNWMLEDDNVFSSMMSSGRRISTIRVRLKHFESDVCFERLIAVIEKFEKDSKKLEVAGFSKCSKEHFSQLLNAASEVEELLLNQSEEGFEAATRRFVPLKMFKKLKRLYLCSVIRVKEVLDRIPDDSLEKLTLVNLRGSLSDQNLQAFLNRQRKIVALYVPVRKKINIDNLVLQKLTLFNNYNTIQLENMMKILKTQPMLRSLDTYKVRSEEFSQISEMRNLEKLSVCIDDVADESIKALRNLQKLEELELTDYNGVQTASKFLILSQIQLPALQKLSMGFRSDTEPEPLAALGQNFPNIQYLDVKYIRPDFLAVIIDEFAALKTLTVHVSGDEHQTRPNHQNQTLEELKIYKLCNTPSLESICFSINACPNLKRIDLRDVSVTDYLILEIIHQHPHLTHFCADVSRTFHVRYESEPEFSWMEEIIDIFRKSPDFIRMKLRGSYFSNQILIQKLLSERFDNFKVRVTQIAVDQDLYTVRIVKNSAIHDPYKNFGETP